MKRISVLLSFFCLFIVTAVAQRQSEVPLADPYILVDGNTYYAYGTHASDGIEVYSSTDLEHWQYETLALSKENTTEQQWFWAPEVYFKNGQYYMYYSANEHLYVATASSPKGPFTQVGGYMMQEVLGSEKCIDSSVFFDDNGQAYLFFVRFTDGNCIWMCELDDDLVTPRAETLRHCFSVSQQWEDLMGRVNEGPFVLKNNGIYYLTYSGNDYRSQDYAVGYAMARSLTNNWQKSSQNPIVRRTENLLGTGHHSFFTDLEGRLRIVFHAHKSDTEVAPRMMYIGTMEFVGNSLRMTSDSIIRPIIGQGDVEQRQVLLKGNIVTDAIELQADGTGTWRVDNAVLDDSKVFLFSDKYVYFECPQTGYRSGNIRINGGTYSVSFRMDDKTWQFTAPIDEYKISAFGSSVCNGQGATGNKGYAYMYGQQLQERYSSGVSETPFHVSGISIGGNNTQNLLDRYGELTRDYGRYVIVGLSMGNEGIHESQNKQQTMTQFSTNMQTIIRKIKADGKIPVVMNNYTRADFTDDDYYYIKQMNLLIHQWDVSSVNTLGAIDDGAGHWASGYVADPYHPTTNGHKEFMYAMTPSLFDAIKSGKRQPVRTTAEEMKLSDGDAIHLRAEGTVHPFTITVRVKGGQEGTVFSYLTTAKRQASVQIDAEGHVVYKNVAGRIMLTTEETMNDNQWHTVTLTHYFAQSRTLLYLDGKAAGETRERVSSLAEVYVGDQANTSVSRQLSELFFWRSAMTPEEVQAVNNGKLLKSSLEVYVPTAGAEQLENRAMSLNTVQFVSHAEAAVRPATVVPSAGNLSHLYYDLSGRRVLQPRKGLYITQHHKVIK